MQDNLEMDNLRSQLQELQARFDFLMSALEHLPNPVFLKDQDARFIYFNKAYADFFGINQEEYVGTTVLDLDYIPMKERERYQEEALKTIKEMITISYDTSYVTPDGSEHPSFYWSRGFEDEKSGRRGLIGEIVDISKERNLQRSLDESLGELKKANEKLRIMAETDHASGLYNRTMLWDKGRKIIDRNADLTPHTCMIMFDLDHFKSINDEFGHLKGDEFLAKFAEILRSECRPTDLPFRYGGDEFLLILNNIEQDDAERVAERIRSRTENELILPNDTSVTVSVGVIETDESQSFERNLTRLDNYLYRAKEQGRNQVVSVRENP